MKKKILSVLLSLAVAVSMTPSMVFAEGEITSTDKLPEANANGVIKLDGDVSLDEGYTVPETVKTIDLNGQTISIKKRITVGNGVELTVTDSSENANGKIVSTGENEKDEKGKVKDSTTAIDVSGGQFTLENGTIQSADHQYGVFANDDGKATVNGGVIDSGYACLSGNNTTGGMNFYINDGTLTSRQSEAVYMPGQTDLVVTGGILNGGISARMGQIKISGGTINGMTVDRDSFADWWAHSGSAWIGHAIYVWGGTYGWEEDGTPIGDTSCNIEITGGTIDGKSNDMSAIAIYEIGNNYDQNIKVQVSKDANVTGGIEVINSDNIKSIEDLNSTKTNAYVINNIGTKKVDTKVTISGGTIDKIIADAAKDASKIEVTGGVFPDLNFKPYSGNSKIYQPNGDTKYYVGNAPANTSGYNTWTQDEETKIYKEAYVPPAPVNPVTTETETKTDADGNKTTTTTTTDNSTGTKTETVVTEGTDGSKSEIVTETKIDGSTSESKTETAADGTVTETSKVVDKTAKTEVETAKTTKTDGSTTESKTETAADGTVTETTKVVDKTAKTEVETAKTTKTDGSTTESKKETAADGTVTETSKVVVVDKEAKTKTEVETAKTTKTDGSISEYKKETAADGTVTETAEAVDKAANTVTKSSKVTNTDGTYKGTTTTTNADNSKETVVSEKTVNSAKNPIEVTTVTKESAEGAKTVEQTSTIELSANSQAVVKVNTDAEGNTEATAEVEKTGTKLKSGATKGVIAGSAVAQIKEAAEAAEDVTIKTVIKDANGKKVFTVTADTEDMKAGNALYILKTGKNGKQTLVNAVKYTVTEKGGVTVSLKVKGNFELVMKAEKNSLVKEIKKTIAPAKKVKTVKKGKKTTMTLKKTLDKANVKSITYKTLNKKVATVNKAGKVTAKKKGTATIKATVTLKDGSYKIVKTKVRVK